MLSVLINHLHLKASDVPIHIVQAGVPPGKQGADLGPGICLYL